MSANGVPVSPPVSSQLESATYEAAATNSTRSAMWHLAKANRYRRLATLLYQSGNAFHMASAAAFARLAAMATAVADSDAKTAAVQRSEAQQITGADGSTRGIES